jgi:hypothetical protein
MTLSAVAHWADTLARENQLGQHGFIKELFSLLAEAQSIMADPNIEGIVIKAEEEVCERVVDVSETMVVGDTGTEKQWVSDNAAPRPRTWTIKGKIVTMFNAIDNGLINKPTILTQIKLLDMFAESRVPVWYKSSTGNFHRVQIKNIRTTFVPNEANAASISVELKEYVAMQVYEVPITGGAGTPGAPPYTSFAQSVKDWALAPVGSGMGVGITAILASVLAIGTTVGVTMYTAGKIGDAAGVVDIWMHGRDTSGPSVAVGAIQGETATPETGGLDGDAEGASDAQGAEDTATGDISTTTTTGGALAFGFGGTSLGDRTSGEKYPDYDPSRKSRFYRIYLEDAPSAQFSQVFILGSLTLLATFSYDTAASRDIQQLLISLSNKYGQIHFVDKDDKPIPMLHEGWFTEVRELMRLYKLLRVARIPGQLGIWDDSDIAAQDPSDQWDPAEVTLQGSNGNIIEDVGTWFNSIALSDGTASGPPTEPVVWTSFSTANMNFRAALSTHRKVYEKLDSYKIMTQWTDAIAKAIVEEDSGALADLMFTAPAAYMDYLSDELLYIDAVEAEIEKLAADTVWTMTLADPVYGDTPVVLTPNMITASAAGHFRVLVEFYKRNRTAIGYDDMAGAALLFEVPYAD